MIKDTNDTAMRDLRSSRASREFDQRFDGPSGRPSLSFWRRSVPQEPSGATSLLHSPDEGDVSHAPVHGRGISTLSPASARLQGDYEDIWSSPSTLTRNREYLPLPPSLNYSLRDRTRSIIIFTILLVLDSALLPVGLYYGLWYGFGPGNPDYHPLSANTVFSIVTAFIGGTSILELVLRCWRLWKKDSDCRVIGATRWTFDWFHWWFTFSWIAIAVELAVASSPERPLRRLLAMPLATVLYIFGTVLLTIDALHYFAIPAPVRISSIPKGSQLRPGIYPLIEDVCAVNGGGKTEFRVALDRRYAASHIFRAMLRRLGFFWAVGAEACAGVTTALVYGLDDPDVAYTIGWCLPFVWAGFWAWATIVYVQRQLKKERSHWIRELRSMV
ncbi:hypothetical protein JX265_001131 [Neoarthrinium moseri]|uniref:Uncharacterized protein n=1 Tax=Neoarthrinium moseri TaxID=1658444 RepID=A0A9P9WX74_9PEZI|nr:uncharacterized protein JN550_007305 [Neoarthrinium moseri]KAI1848801.1 hypothetical protein JX266_005229 [Neoarthrinium moseri]KAI1866758.1 hypothetical protein JN550_007305 [Neoarthrinium moseri]KAI1880891.1 hypothetical protein JX265_001131 [Neoarthrinium moseri]